MASRKKKLLSDIADIVDGIEDYAGYHHKEIEGMGGFVDKLQLLLEKEAPEFVPKFEEIAGQMKESLDHDTKIVEAEERLMEDLNDIAARFEVVYRISEESVSAKQKFHDACAKIDKLKKNLEADAAKGGPKRFKIENDIKQAIEGKKAAKLLVEEKLQALIAAKEKYALFKVRRMRNGYTTVGSVMAEELRRQAQVMDRLMRTLGEAKEGIDIVLDGGTMPVSEAPPAPVETETPAVDTYTSYSQPYTQPTPTTPEPSPSPSYTPYTEIPATYGDVTGYEDPYAKSQDQTYQTGYEEAYNNGYEQPEGYNGAYGESPF